MSQILYVINPNSSSLVTADFDAAIEPLRRPDDIPIPCVTLPDGPPGIESQLDVDRAALAVHAFAQAHRSDAAGFVIACFSDPGLALMREQMRVPVFGISEAAALTAMTLGQRFGVIAMREGSVLRHLRAWGAMGIMDRLAGEAVIGRGVTALADREATLAAMLEAGRRLRSQHQADVIVMGCAGMSTFRGPLAEQLGVPVIDPVQAAVAMAIGRVRLGW